MEGLLLSAGASAVGALTSQMVFVCISGLGDALGGGACAGLTAVGGAAACVVGALAGPAAGATVHCAASLASGLASRSLRTTALTLAAASSSLTGIGTALVVSAAGHAVRQGLALAAQAVVRFQTRQRGLGEWVAGVEDGLDGLRWVVLQAGGGEEELGCAWGKEDASARLYALFAQRTSPRSARSTFTAYLGHALSARAEAGAEGGEGESLVVALPSPSAGAGAGAPPHAECQHQPEWVGWVLIPLPSGRPLRTFWPQPMY